MVVASILSNPNHLYINGKWVEPTGTDSRNVYNPTNGEVVLTLKDANAKDAALAIQAAQEAFEKGPWHNEYSGMKRRDALLKISDLIIEHRDNIAKIESLNTGKPIGNSTFEAMHGAEVFRYFAGLADKQQGRHNVPAHDPGFDSYTLVEPKGVIGLIVAFNFPFILSIWKLAPALATGNTVVLKPSPQTPLSALYLAQIINDNNVLPPGVLNVIPGNIEAGVALTESPYVDMISFTGSVGGGKAVYRASAGSANLKHVALELGGKSPNVIMDDADVTAAAQHAAAAAFINTGQTCCAGTKLYVHRKIYDQFVATLKVVAETIASKMTTDVTTSSIGPLIDQNQLNRVTGFVDRAIESNNVEVIAGGKRWGTTGFYFLPTVLKASKDTEVACEEIFGPVVTILPPFDDLEEVIQHENENPFGLAAGIYTNNAKAINRFVRTMKAGTVWVNCFNALMPYMPFGGYKNSGIGRELGEEAVREFVVTKSVTAKY
ncbi:hypothetical protein BB559_005434 [Furculomyces boomerangus]|uniref:Aldehyde dehydrogenase domain-containing protein n=2 Tax=Harpellales TaxID=61421 RepID=A0A2T9Y8P9_9FUNG|nr:hypothetical protein BB559_005434 [Furculomyces boomerangus]PWA01089.1 hypothetical protein BB558_002820 [Smittium angustum]